MEKKALPIKKKKKRERETERVGKEHLNWKHL